LSKPLTAKSLCNNSWPFCFCVGYLFALAENAKPRKKTQLRAAGTENVPWKIFPVKWVFAWYFVKKNRLNSVLWQNTTGKLIQVWFEMFFFNIVWSVSSWCHWLLCLSEQASGFNDNRRTSKKTYFNCIAIHDTRLRGPLTFDVICHTDVACHLMSNCVPIHHFVSHVRHFLRPLDCHLDSQHWWYLFNRPA
jgi:hypothetical protein